MQLLLLSLPIDNSSYILQDVAFQGNECIIFEKISKAISCKDVTPDLDNFVFKDINDDGFFVHNGRRFEESDLTAVTTGHSYYSSETLGTLEIMPIIIYPWEFSILSEKLKNKQTLLFDIASYNLIMRSLYDPIRFPNVSPRQLMIYGDVVTSTQTILEKNWFLAQNFPHGTVFLASHQTQGKGRSGNKWISAPGCLQFTMIWDVDARYQMGNGAISQSAATLYQYYAALAMVESVLSIDGYENLPLKVKWPNDIYCFISNNIQKPISRKIGGVLVQANYINDKSTRLLIGLGINIDNPKPTYCLNEMISDLQLGDITRELVLARFSLMFPALVQKWSTNFDQFQKDYKNRWIHYEHVVCLQEDNLQIELLGLRQDGYLLARNCTSNEEIGIQPGLYSFDIEQCMIMQKKSC